MLQHRLRHFINHYCTSQCHLCGLTIEQLSNTIWCSHCRRYFMPAPRCQRCGLPTLADTPLCGQCLTEPPPWQRLFCVGDYLPPLSGYIQQLKHQRKYWLAKDLAYLLAPRIATPAPVITSVPLHWQRQIKRGFNQSALLGAHLATQLTQPEQAVRCDNRLFKRVIATPPQQGLDKQQRMQNLKHAFALQKHPAHRHIAIVDDVVTTGSTVRNLCLQLLDIGVESIDIYCICRTPEPAAKT